MQRIVTAWLVLLAGISLACQNQAGAPAITSQPAVPEKTATPLPDVAALLRKLATQDAAKDATAEMRMQMESPEGKQAQLEFQLQRKYEAGRVATFLKVLAPREDSDKAILAIESEGKPTEAFSYLAGLRKLAKLGSSNTFNFRDSKVTVQELLGMELGQYDFDAGARLTEDSAELIKTEGKAKRDRNLAFPRINVYFNASTLQPARFELFDERGQLHKTMRVDEVKALQNRQTLTKITVEEPAAKRIVKVETRAIKYDQNLPSKIFTEEYLKSFITSASLKLAQ